MQVTWRMISIIILIIFLLIIATLLFPVTISVNSTKSGGKVIGNIHLNWIILVIQYSLKERLLEILVSGRRIFHRISLKEKRQTLKHPKKPGKSKRPMPTIKDFFNIMRPVLQLFKELVHAFRLKFFDCDITFGLNDPAYTGIMTGFLHAAGLSGAGNIRWTPDFTGLVLDWNLRVKASVVPIRLLPPLARFITNRKILGLIKGIIG